MREQTVRGGGALSAGGARPAPTEPTGETPPTSDWGYPKGYPQSLLANVTRYNA